MFFPFDPYLLRRSARFLKLPSSYNTWGGGHQHDTDASHLSSDDELEVPEGMQGSDACLLLQMQLRFARLPLIAPASSYLYVAQQYVSA